MIWNANKTPYFNKWAISVISQTSVYGGVVWRKEGKTDIDCEACKFQSSETVRTCYRGTWFLSIYPVSDMCFEGKATSLYVRSRKGHSQNMGCLKSFLNRSSPHGVLGAKFWHIDSEQNCRVYGKKYRRYIISTILQNIKSFADAFDWRGKKAPLDMGVGVVVLEWRIWQRKREVPDMAVVKIVLENICLYVTFLKK